MSWRKMLYVTLLVMFAGCREKVVDGPPDIKFGRDECAHCGMIINDKRYAAGLVTMDQNRRKVLVFDDIGDLLDYERDHASLVVTHRYVVDRDSGQWLNAAEAHFARIADLQTPMGSGIAAFASGNARQVASIPPNTKLLTLEELRNAVK